MVCLLTMINEQANLSFHEGCGGPHILVVLPIILDYLDLHPTLILNLPNTLNLLGVLKVLSSDKTRIYQPGSCGPGGPTHYIRLPRSSPHPTTQPTQYFRPTWCPKGRTFR